MPTIALPSTGSPGAAKRCSGLCAAARNADPRVRYYDRTRFPPARAGREERRMPPGPTPLTSAALSEHARQAARSDEQRHRLDSDHAVAHPSEDTRRGWGNAALTELEWQSSYIYPRALHSAYQRVYAATYQRQRAAWIAAHHGPTRTRAERVPEPGLAEQAADTGAKRGQ